ncbi:TetR/AcrR family transcriptional regulator [Floccifex sp.]|uniref:TetR/AcrR family transcriptional regulator n=1 Tax=Floccifex sp. TaxID=2815810 RepID=UPI003F08C8B6
MKHKVIENKKQKEQSLLQAAFELFSQQEIHTVSVSDIVQKAGVAKGTFYLYFKDKYEIRDVLIARQAHSLFDFAIQELESNDIRDFEDRVIFIINQVILQLQSNPSTLNFLQKNLSVGLFQTTLNQAIDKDSFDLVQRFSQEAKKANFHYEKPGVILYMIVELAGSTCYDAILRKRPLPMEEYKPYLFDAIRSILSKGKE